MKTKFNEFINEELLDGARKSKKALDMLYDMITPCDAMKYFCRRNKLKKYKHYLEKCGDIHFSNDYCLKISIRYGYDRITEYIIIYIMENEPKYIDNIIDIIPEKFIKKYKLDELDDDRFEKWDDE